MNQSELQQLPIQETSSLSQYANNVLLSVEDIEALELTEAMPVADTRNATIASTNGSTDIKLELALLRTRAIKP